MNLILFIQSTTYKTTNVVQFINEWLLNLILFVESTAYNTTNVQSIYARFLWTWFFLLNQQHTTQPIYSNSWMNDSYELHTICWINSMQHNQCPINSCTTLMNLILFNELATYTTTNIFQFMNEYKPKTLFLVNQKHNQCSLIHERRTLNNFIFSESKYKTQSV